MARRFGFGLAVLALGALWLGFFGGWVRAFDTLAIHRPVWGLICLVAAVAVAGLPWRIAFGAAAAAAALTVIPPLIPEEPGDDLRIYSKNLLRSNEDLVVIADDIRATAPDVVLLQEVSDVTGTILEDLRTDYPHQHLCPYVDWGGIAVLARHPFEGERRCSAQRGIAAARLTLPDGPVWAGSIHLPLPWPVKQPDNRATVLDVLSSLDGPVVLGGDFNQMPWSARVREVGDVHGLDLAGPVRPTHRLWGVPIPIDMILAPAGGRVERRGTLSSDHVGLVADIDLDPATHAHLDDRPGRATLTSR